MEPSAATHLSLELPGFSDLLIVAHTPEKGKHLIARCALVSGSIVLKCTAYAWGLTLRSWPKWCEHCLRDRESKHPVLCPACRIIAFCCDECQKACAAHEKVCKAYRRLSAKGREVEALGEAVHLVRFMLCVVGRRLVEEQEGIKWAQSECARIGSLMSHEASLSDPDRKLYLRVESLVRSVLDEPALAYLLPSSVPALLSIARCNRFALFGLGDTCAGTVISYPASLFNHSCVPNTGVLIEKNSLTFRTLFRVEAGQELCISYLNLTHTESLRREELMTSYHFLCSCQLCNGDELSKLEARKRIRQLTCSECDGLIVPLVEENICVCRNCYKRTEYASSS